MLREAKRRGIRCFAMKTRHFVSFPLAACGMLLAASIAPALSPEPWSDARIGQRIQQHRTAEVSLTITDAAGKPVTGEVTVEQLRHKFLFGANAFMIGRCGDEQAEAAYRRQFAHLFNFATLGFYWGAYEHREGHPDVDRLRMMATWCADSDIRPKGHPLCWHNVAPKWLYDREIDAIERAELARIQREVSAFRGLIDTWDVVNEVIDTPGNEQGRNPIARWCQKLGRVGMIKATFDQARRSNPDAALILNDYRVDDAYAKIIRESFDADVPIDVIGLQSHMHTGVWSPQKIWQVCERFAGFGKPLHFTELTILSGPLKTSPQWNKHHQDWLTTPEGEATQAEQVRAFYRLAFSHPAVEAITWWDFSDRGAWMTAPAGLVRKDMTPKPAYQALDQLIRHDWWTGPRKLSADEAGQIRFRGFLGAYRLTAGDRIVEFQLNAPGQQMLTVQLP